MAGSKLKKIIDMTEGRKPGKNQRVNVITLVCENPHREQSYRVIQNIVPEPRPLSRSEIRKQERSNYLLFHAVFFGPAQGAGYYWGR